MENITLLDSDNSSLKKLLVFSYANNIKIDMSFCNFILDELKDKKTEINQEINLMISKKNLEIKINTNMFNILTSLEIYSDVIEFFYSELMNIGLDITKKQTNNYGDKKEEVDNIFSNRTNNKSLFLIKKLKEKISSSEFIKRADDSYIIYDAVINLNYELVANLVESGVDVNIRNNQYKTPVMYVQNDKMLNLFINKANFSAKDINGKSVISYIKEIPDTSIVNNMLSLLSNRNTKKIIDDSKPSQELINNHLIELVNNGNMDDIKKFIAKHKINTENIIDEDNNTLPMLLLSRSFNSNNYIKRLQLFEKFNINHINNEGELFMTLLFHLADRHEYRKLGIEYRDLFIKYMNKETINPDFISSIINSSLKKYESATIPHKFFEENTFKKIAEVFNIPKNMIDKHDKQKFESGYEQFYDFLSYIPVDYSKLNYNFIENIFEINKFNNYCEYDINKESLNKHLMFIHYIIPQENHKKYYDELFLYMSSFINEGLLNHTGKVDKTELYKEEIIIQENKQKFVRVVSDFIELLNEYKSYDSLKNINPYNGFKPEIQSILLNAKLTVLTENNKKDDRKLKI